MAEWYCGSVDVDFGDAALYSYCTTSIDLFPIQVEAMLARNSFFYSLIFLFFGVPAVANAAAKPAWEITQFEVFFGEPWYTPRPHLTDAGRVIDSTISLDEVQSRPSYIPQATVTEIQNYLHETAKLFESMGLRAPQLEPVVERTDGQKAYRIYFYKTEHKAPAIYRNGCLDGFIRQLIEVHLEPGSGFVIDGNGKITDKGYADLAHELFHGVQASYPLFTDCALGDWIVEGTAEAIGYDTVLKLRGIDPRGHASLGLRRYNEALRIEDDPVCLQTDASGPGCGGKRDGYWSASLWRYIGEMFRKGGAFPPTTYTAPNYDYFDDFFSNKLQGAPSETSELLWLDDNLTDTKRFGKSLNRVYSTFTTAFSAYPKTRPGASGAATKSKETVWLDTVFGSCSEITINPDESPILIAVKLNKVASACLRLTTETGSPMHIQLTAHPEGSANLQDLWAGVSSGMSVGPAIQVEAEGSNFAEWRFRVDLAPGESTTLVINNVAADAEKTEPQTLNLRLTASLWNMSLEGP